ncbi:MAG: hypothetical protein ACI9FB_003905 [Candidatus Azotimanducaceae bacterium]|jgi:hypothetical protein
MNSERDRPNMLSVQRFRIIIEAYGANSDKWPDDEKNDALLLLETNPDAKIIFDLQQKLDHQLDTTYVKGVNLERLSLGILNNLPKQESATILERLLKWLIPAETTAIWKPALAAFLPLMLGITYGAQLSFSNAEDNWDQEFYLSSLLDTAIVAEITTETNMIYSETPEPEKKDGE